MRKAEYVMAAIMALFSVYLMVKSAELPIGWQPRKGPGGGAFPFWLSLGMLICCAWIALRAWRGSTPESRSQDPYMDRVTLRHFLITAGSICVMVGLFHVVGVYLAVPLFFIFHIRFVGRHSWWVAGTMAVVTPVFTFFFFEIGLRILLPKGYTEEFFYPLYGYFF